MKMSLVVFPLAAMLIAGAAALQAQATSTWVRSLGKRHSILVEAPPTLPRRIQGCCAMARILSGQFMWATAALTAVQTQRP